MSMKVKNITKQTLNVVGFGVVKPDGIIDVPDDFNNANFEKVIKKPTETGDKADQTANNNK